MKPLLVFLAICTSGFTSSVSAQDVRFLSPKIKMVAEAFFGSGWQQVIVFDHETEYELADHNSHEYGGATWSGMSVYCDKNGSFNHLVLGNSDPSGALSSINPMRNYLLRAGFTSYEPNQSALTVLKSIVHFYYGGFPESYLISPEGYLVIVLPGGIDVLSDAFTSKVLQSERQQIATSKKKKRKH